jgi:ribonuclease inhibitor
MRRADLDGTLKDLDAVYDAIYAPLSEGLDVPAFGHNLDALWDVLTAWIPGPVEIVWKDHAKVRRRIGRRLDRLIATLREVEKERKDFRLVLG